MNRTGMGVPEMAAGLCAGTAGGKALTLIRAARTTLNGGAVT